MKQYAIGEPSKQNGRLSYDLNTIQRDGQSETNTEKSEKIKKIVKISLIAAVVLVPCIIFGSVMYKGYVETEKSYKEIEREYTELAMSYVTEYEVEEDIPEDIDANMGKTVDFAALMQQEKDIYAWINIPETGVDYPILQSGDNKNDDYWLNHNLDGSTGYPGTIFTERMFGKDFKPFNTVIYGHNMKNQTMFGGLHNYEHDDYLEKHPYIYIYTPQMTYKYQVVCAATISDVHLAVAYNGYKTESQRQQFLNYLLSNAVTMSGIETDIYDNYITLSTCTNSEVRRFVVLAKCIDKVSSGDYD
jgi:sortase B